MSYIDVLWKIDDIHKVLQQRNDVYSDVFTTKDEGIKMKAILHLEELFQNYIRLEIVSGSVNSNAMPLYRLTLRILDQCESNEKKHIWRINEPAFGATTYNSIHLASESRFKELLRRNSYVKNNSIRIQILLEPIITLYKHVFSTDGIINWKLDDFGRGKNDGIDRVTLGIHSSYFYSSNRGYRMKLQLIFWSFNSIWINLCFVHGEYDDELADNCPLNVTVQIMDQSDSKEKKHLTKS